MFTSEPVSFLSTEIITCTQLPMSVEFLRKMKNSHPLYRFEATVTAHFLKKAKPCGLTIYSNVLSIPSKILVEPHCQKGKGVTVP